MELNGLANIHMLLTLETDKAQDSSGNVIHYMNEETFNSIKKQLDLLQQYMVKYHEAVIKEHKVPNWHDISLKK